MNHYLNYDITGDVYRSDEVYSVIDNLQLNKLVLSQVVLHKLQRTRGHTHEGCEEVYFFQFGQGTMVVGTEFETVTAGSIVLVPDGQFHKVINTGLSDLIFHTVYNKTQDRTVYAK